MLVEKLATYLNDRKFDDDMQLFHYPLLIQDSMKFIPLHTAKLLKEYLSKLDVIKSSLVLGNKFVILDEIVLAENFKIFKLEAKANDCSIPKEKLSILTLGDKIVIICFDQEALPNIEGFTKLKSLELTRLTSSQ